MPSEHQASETRTPTPVGLPRQQAFRSRCAAELRQAYDYVTVFPEPGDEGIDILVQTASGGPIPVHCNPEAITAEEVGRFAGSLLVQAFRRGLVLTGNGRGPLATEPYPSDVLAAVDALRRDDITLRLLSLPELGLLDWA